VSSSFSSWCIWLVRLTLYHLFVVGSIKAGQYGDHRNRVSVRHPVAERRQQQGPTNGAPPYAVHRRGRLPAGVQAALPAPALSAGEATPGNDRSQETNDDRIHSGRGGKLWDDDPPPGKVRLVLSPTHPSPARLVSLLVPLLVPLLLPRARSLFPSAIIVSVEPDPSNALVLRENTAHLPNVHVVEAGLWDVTGKIALKGNHGQWGRVFQRVDDDDPSGMLAYSVSHIMRKFDIPRFDLVKMDIEGSEAVVLGGQDVRWLQDVKVLFAEVHDMFAGYFGLSQERQEVTEIVERVVFSKMKGAVRTEDNEHVVYFGPGVVEGV